MALTRNIVGLMVAALISFSAVAQQQAGSVPALPSMSASTPDHRDFSMNMILPPPEGASKEEKESYYAPIKAKCAATGGTWGLFGNQAYPRCQSAKEKVLADECAKKGGVLVAAGKAQTPSCRIPYADANKPCDENEECLSKKCLVDKTSKDHGICQRDNNTFGCFEYYQKPGLFSKKVPGKICTD